MSLILRVGWVWPLEKYVTKFYVTNWEGRVGLNPNMYHVEVVMFTLFLVRRVLTVEVVEYSLSCRVLTLAYLVNL
jgi:hypothetical protein